MKYSLFVFFLSFFFLNPTAEAQTWPLSEEAEITILTIGPGPNLYDKFGHSAFRIKDATHGTDAIFNYGTFDFRTPNFYTKFAQGKLLYSLSVGHYEDFYQSYVLQNRWIKEQVLDLTYPEKRALADFLVHNAQPENRDYLYDFCFDNCATRIRDVLVSSLNEKVTYPTNFLKETSTFRKLIQKNVHFNTWGSVGMDIAIGAVTDVEATPWQHQFLPEYVFEAAAVATLETNGNSHPLVKDTRMLYENAPTNERGPFLLSPLFVFSIIALLILYLTFKDYRNKTRSRFLDSSIFFVTGLIGVILLLLWFATDHSATRNNYNLLWAFPFSLLFTLTIGKKQPKRWVRRYLAFLLVLFALLILHSITGVQKFAIAFIPLFLALIVRYVYVISFLKKQEV
ncbi:MAG: DUF4105 domain-containing protein [Bacteroidota bacterium]